MAYLLAKLYKQALLLDRVLAFILRESLKPIVNELTGQRYRDNRSIFSRLDKGFKEVGLVVNRCKPKYLLSSTKQSTRSRLS